LIHVKNTPNPRPSQTAKPPVNLEKLTALPAYARLRANALPRIVAFRKAGNTAKNDHVADANSARLEKKPGVRERISILAGRRTARQTKFRGFPMPSSSSNYPTRRNSWA
jgi:hypothetical protein